MIDIGAKSVTHRVAIARGEIQISERVRRAIEEKKVPKHLLLAREVCILMALNFPRLLLLSGK